MNFTQYEIRIKALDEATQSLRRLPEEARKAARGVEQAGGLRGLKKQLGEESGFGLGVKTLAGAGALAGVTLLTRGLSQATDKAVELRDALNAGKISSGEMADELARSLPVLGNIYTAGRNIRELFTGENAAVAGIKAEAAAMDAIFDARKHSLKESETALKNMAKILRDTREEGLLAGSKGTLSGDLLQLRISARGKSESISTALEAEKKRIAEGAMVLGPDGKNVSAAQRLGQIDQELAPLRSEERSLSGMYGKEYGDSLKVIDDLRRKIASTEARRAPVAALVEKEKLDTAKAGSLAVKAGLSNLENYGKGIGREYSEAGKEIAKGFQKKIKEVVEQDKRIGESLDRGFFDVIDSVDRAERERLDRPAKERIDESLDKFFDFESDVPEFMKPDRAKRFSDAVESRGTGVGALARSQSLDPAVQVAKDSNKILKDTNKLTQDLVTGMAALVRGAQLTPVYNGAGSS